jgi:hypothetical protein
MNDPTDPPLNPQQLASNVTISDPVPPGVTAAPNPAILENQLRALAIKGDLRTVRGLLARGVNPNMKNRSGDTALIYAAENDHVKIVRDLLEAGANPNLQNSDGDTALSLASIFARPETVQLLLAGNADPTIRNNDHETPLEALHMEMIRYRLASAGANTENDEMEHRIENMTRNEPLLEQALARRTASEASSATIVGNSSVSGGPSGSTTASGGPNSSASSLVNRNRAPVVASGAEGPSSVVAGRRGILNTVTGAFTNCFGRMCGRGRPHQNRTSKGRRNRRRSTRRRR